MGNGGHPRISRTGTRYISVGKTGHKICVVKTDEGSWRAGDRVKAEARLGRKLQRGEEVHHRYGNSLNNEDENLKIVTHSEHMRLHVEAEKLGLATLIASEWTPSTEGMAC